MYLYRDKSLIAMFVRRKSNKSGSISIYVVDKSRGRYTVVKSFGTVRTEAAADLLENKAREWVREQEGDPETLFDRMDEAQLRDYAATLPEGRLELAGPELLYGELFDRLGLGVGKEPLFRHLVLCRVFAGGGIDAVDKDKLAEGYALLTKAVEWWLKNRSLPDGSFFYAYTHESGWDGAPVLPFGQGAVSPDLAAWMAMNAGALEAMAKKLGLEKEAENWAALMQKQLAVVASLWKDGKFVCRSALTGDEVPCPVGIGLLPILLGDAAPDAAALRAKAEKAERLPFEQAALIALECPALAGKLIAAGAEAPGTLSGGAYRPVVSALLLALEERS